MLDMTQEKRAIGGDPEPRDVLTIHEENGNPLAFIVIDDGGAAERVRRVWFLLKSMGNQRGATAFLEGVVAGARFCSQAGGTVHLPKTITDGRDEAGGS